ncbi:MAG: hypothetical protein HOM88_03660 [Hellea sp.]|jgi:hypothetical protein|nr:hypothetical protein [Hellea sp.]
MSKLIRISDVIETKLRKEKELEFYREQIEKIKTKMSFLQKDLDITNIIINIIENEKVMDVKENMEKRMIGEFDARDMD